MTTLKMGEEIEASTEAAEQYAIGISFGNSNSSIAHLSSDGKAQVIANEEGDRLIPSVLSYVEGEEFYGQQAKNQIVRNSSNTVAYFRDLLGKEFEAIDPTHCQASARPQERDSTTVFSIKDTQNDEPSLISVLEVSQRYISRLKQSASDYSGKTVTSAVIAIPTDASDSQKAVLAEAVQKADLKLLQYVAEPIAALVAHDVKGGYADKIVAVADFGGTRSDVAIIASRGGMYSILATLHDYNLGGAQLDQVLIDYFAKEFIKKHKTDPRENARSLAKLKLEAESVKKALSQSASATFSAESLADGIDFRLSLNKTRYELLGGKILQSLGRLVEEAVKKADLDMLEIDEVLLSGGTSHTPRLAQNIQGLFPKTTTVVAPSTSTTAINPAFLSASGAAIQASLIQEFDQEDIDQSSHPMVTVTPHISAPIGVEIQSKGTASSFDIVISQDSAVPIRKTKILKSLSDGEMVLRVCEGERQIKVTKPDPLPNGTTKTQDGSDEDSDLDDEEQEVRERIWVSTRPLSEITAKVKKGLKVEITINVGADLSVSVSARELGSQSGVRGNLAKPEPVENGKV